MKISITNLFIYLNPLQYYTLQCFLLCSLSPTQNETILLVGVSKPVTQTDGFAPFLMYSSSP